ncbi:MAG: glycosyltransferase family 2 protein [Candidatus Falkowbacteria bacterium]
MPKVFIVIPAYNESTTIARVISDIRAVNSEYDIVVVDDKSQDNTNEIVKQNNTKVLQHIINRGQGAALRTGTEYALQQGADVVVHFDADGQFLANEIKEVIQPILNNEVDVVFGSRFLPSHLPSTLGGRGKKSDMPALKKYLIMPLARFINRYFFGIKLTDPQSGFRAMSQVAAQKINWQQDRMAHCSEIMRQVFSQKLKYKEVPTTVIYQDFGQKFSGGLKILKDMFLGNFIK